MGWNRLRIYALVAAVALLSTLVVVPAFGADGDDPVDAIEFTAVDGVPRFVYGELVPQVLTTGKNGCEITSAETIVDLTGAGGVPGLNDNSIGIKARGPNSNGTPCSQIDNKETLTIQPGNAMTGALLSKVRLDLEMTGDAVVRLTLSDGGDNTDTFILQTGTNATATQKTEADFDTQAPFFVFTSPETDTDNTDACASSTSSGPNSHASDNCIWTVEPGFDFDTIELTVDTGTASLEGGSDTGAANTTLFFLAPNRINCDENVVFPGVDAPTYTARAENGGEACEKDFTYDAGEHEGDPFVELVTSGDTTVVFLELLELEPQVFTGDSQTPSLYYDDNLSDGIQETLAPFCLVDPRVVGTNGDPVFDLAGAYDSAAEAHLVLPTVVGSNPLEFTDTTCIISAEFVTVGTDEAGDPLVKATYHLYNLNDGFRTFK